MKEFAEKRFVMLTSAGMTLLIFCVFFGQALLSDVTTFLKSGDMLRLSYPAFLKLATYKSWMGVDIGTFNGATEFFLRPNLSNMYLPLILSSYIVKFVPARLIFILFYMGHMYIAIYYAQKTAQKFFSLSRNLALLVSCSFLPVILYESWYTSFYIIASLTFVVLYYALGALDNSKKRYWILYSFPYVLAFTSGYITISLVLAAFTTITAIVFGYNYRKELSRQVIILRAIIPLFIAGCINLLYYFQVLIYTKKVASNGSPTLFDALIYKVDIRNLPLVISSAFRNVSPIEQLGILSIGFIWIVVIGLFIEQALLKSMDKSNRNFFLYGILINVTILIIAFGDNTPLALWFYSLFPVIGSMHLPLRYMIVTLPVLYLSLGIGVKYIPEGKGKKLFKILYAVCAALVIIISLYSSQYNIPFINVTMMIVQLLLASVVFYSIYQTGFTSRITIIVWCICVVFPGLIDFYKVNETAAPKTVFQERSIVYNQEYQKKLDNFIGTLPRRDLYKFAAYDTKDDVPQFLPGNYEWYGASKYNLTNYIGYEIHISTPKDYLNNNPWFNRPNWEYILNTRGDFLVMDQASINKDNNFFSTIADMENSNVFIDNTERIVKLKKFVPSHYTKEKYLLDDPETLDNGYFYSHDLKNSALTNFTTDKATYYRANINASVPTDLAFLLYPNRYYKYFVDGKEVSPIIDRMQAFIPLTKGEHVVSIEYKNTLNQVSNIVYYLYYSLILVASILLVLKLKRVRKL